MVSPLLGGSFATGAVPTAKIGVIDIERTLYDTPAGKRANDQFEKTRKEKQAKLDARQQELKKLDEDLGKQASVLKPDMLAKRRDELQQKFVDLRQLYLQLERDLATERTKLVQGLLAKATPMIQEIAKAEGVSLVIDRSAAVWFDPAADLTARLNAKMK
ncbi:MAG: OmpH family outer membrane protein [Kofleriaceae bacterium]